MPYPISPIPATSYTPAYGGIPSVPSPISTAGEAVRGNIGNLGGLYQLAGGVNAFNQQQAALGLQTNLPGYQGMVGQSSQNIAANLAGQVDPQVYNQLVQSAAERGTSTGLGTNAPNISAALLAALGKTSYGQKQLGEQQLTAAIGRTPQGPVFDPSKFFVTPEQEQQAQAAANLYASAPVPSAAAAEARKQATAGIGATVGAPGVQLPAGSPFKATTWSAPTSVSAGGGAEGMTYGGQTYYGGATPQTAATNWNQWYAGIPKTAPAANPMYADEYFGTPSTATTGGPMYADEYDQLTGLSAAPTGAGPMSSSTVGWQPGGALPGTETQSLGDLFGTLTPEDLASFG